MRVLIFGTFDVIHPGHIQMIRQARGYGDRIACIVARDSTVEKIKGKKPQNNEETRVENLKKLGLLDMVMLGHIEDPYNVLEAIKPDVICLGYDQISFTEKLQDELLKRNIDAKIVRLSSYKDNKYKSSKLQE